jgi:flagellar basal body rod protein FlgG
MSASAAALRYWERRQEVASNNLANVSTQGFKGDRVFARMMNSGTPAADANTDFSQGSITPTGNPYDLAVDGKAFMVVRTENGERLTRGGTMRVDENGYLTDSNGNALMGESGPIQVATRGNTTPGTISISNTGVVNVGNTEVGRLRLETIEPGAQLTREGSGLYVPPDKRTPLDNDATVVRQGALEESNVSTISQMVDMIAIQRAYTAVQKAMSTLDATRGIATTELGRPEN